MKEPRKRCGEGRPQVRRGLLRNLLLVTLVTASVVGTVLLVGAYRAVNALSETAIEQAMDRTGSELEMLFGSTEVHLGILAEAGARGAFSLADEDLEELNRQLIPVLSRVPQVTSVLVADSGGREVLLLQQESGWLNRLIDEAERPGQARWIRRDGRGGVEEEQDEETEYRTGTRPWFQGAMGSEDGEFFWTAPYTFFTTRDPGITVSTSFVEPRTGRRWVLALDVMLLDVSFFTAGLMPTENAQVVVFTSTGRVVGLPGEG